MAHKIFVLDTNVLIHNPKALFSFADNDVVVPITVIEEVDQFKKGLDEKGRNARQIGRYLDELRSKGSLRDGVPTEHGGTIKVALSHRASSASEILINDTNDNLIIGTALHEHTTHPQTDVILVSKDANVRIKADAVGLIAENYESDKVKFEELYTGVTEVELTEKRFQAFLQEGFLSAGKSELYPNEFVRLVNKRKKSETVLARYSSANSSFYPLSHYTLGDQVFGITARNEEQAMALDLLLDNSVRLVSLAGIAGTGKTLLAMAAGLHQVMDSDLYNRLVISRPISPMGKDLGFLPGTKAEKFNPWMQPIRDNMEILLTERNSDEENNNGRVFGKKRTSLDEYLDFGFIELEPLTYIRGRSLPNQFIIIDEAQNLTPHEMKTIITRAGEGTKIVLTGDPYQIDIPYLDSESNGLSMVVEKLKHEDIVGHVTLMKGERSQLAEIAAKYF